MAWKPIHFALAGMMVVFGKITLIVEYRGVHRVEIPAPVLETTFWTPPPLLSILYIT